MLLLANTYIFVFSRLFFFHTFHTFFPQNTYYYIQYHHIKQHLTSLLLLIFFVPCLKISFHNLLNMITWFHLLPFREKQDSLPSQERTIMSSLLNFHTHIHTLKKKKSLGHMTKLIFFSLKVLMKIWVEEQVMIWILMFNRIMCLYYMCRQGLVKRCRSLLWITRKVVGKEKLGIDGDVFMFPKDYLKCPKSSKEVKQPWNDQ